jgi:uncharacterized repeat protein (TIGR01451 family)
MPTVVAYTADRKEVTASDSFTLEVFRPLPVLAVEKSADSNSPIPGGFLNYTINYQNIGGADAHNVVLKDSYHVNTTFVSDDPASDSGTIDRWSLGDLAMGASGKIKIQTRVLASAMPGSVITNKVNMTCQEKNWATSMVNTTVAGMVLNITKSASSNPGTCLGTSE